MKSFKVLMTLIILVQTTSFAQDEALYVDIPLGVASESLTFSNTEFEDGADGSTIIIVPGPQDSQANVEKDNTDSGSVDGSVAGEDLRSFDEPLSTGTPPNYKQKKLAKKINAISKKIDQITQEIAVLFNEEAVHDAEVLDGAIAEIGDQLQTTTLDELEEHLDRNPVEKPSRWLTSLKSSSGKKVRQLETRISRSRKALESNSFPNSTRRNESLDHATVSLEEADKFYARGDFAQGDLASDITVGLIDFSLSVLPVTSFAKDAYELVTGTNAVTGEALSDFDHGMAIFGVATLGFGGLFKSAVSMTVKVGQTISRRIGKVIPASGDKVVGGILDSGKNVGIKTRESFNDLAEWLGKPFPENRELGAIIIGKYKPPPKFPEAFDNLIIAKRKTPSAGGGLRKRWKDNKGNIYEWDSQHGAIEKYNKNGKHLGEFDSNTGVQTKPANPSRTVEK